MFDLIAFDADDTLWHNEIHYERMAEILCDFLKPYCTAAETERHLYETEMRNLPLYGYGTKGFMLSVIETAIQVSSGKIESRSINQLIQFGHEMLAQNIELLPHVPETLDKLSSEHILMVITKGDLFDQEAKLARSGIAHYFQHTEIVSDKSQQKYQELLAKYGVDPAQFLMTGNSLKSDVMPVASLGATAVHIPYAITWLHEVDHHADTVQQNHFRLEHMGQLPDLIRTLQNGSAS
ncbi:MAG: HAD family hydrolase [Candidatus Promineifilaceae bacterium]|nr:HAD family hydrolase [Candidatus Promineifilaceae bacterium]